VIYEEDGVRDEEVALDLARLEMALSIVKCQGHNAGNIDWHCYFKIGEEEPSGKHEHHFEVIHLQS
jgi:hypothetical protein